MLNKLVIPDIVFDFDTNEVYHQARSSGYIDDYKMARITRVHVDGYSVDYPCHNREDFVNSISRCIKVDTIVSLEAYQSVHYYDINDYQ
jgi:hypothetical protein